MFRAKNISADFHIFILAKSKAGQTVFLYVKKKEFYAVVQKSLLFHCEKLLAKIESEDKQYFINAYETCNKSFWQDSVEQELESKGNAFNGQR